MEVLVLFVLVLSAIVGKGFFEWGTSKIPSFDSKGGTFSVAILWVISFIAGGGFFILFFWILEWVNF